MNVDLRFRDQGIPVNYGHEEDADPQLMIPANRQSCSCDEIDPQDIPCLTCTASASSGIGAPPGARMWPPEQAIPSDVEVTGFALRYPTNGGKPVTVGKRRHDGAWLLFSYTDAVALGRETLLPPGTTFEQALGAARWEAARHIATPPAAKEG